MSLLTAALHIEPCKNTLSSLHFYVKKAKGGKKEGTKKETKKESKLAFSPL